MYCDMCIYNFIWYIDNDKYEFNSRTVGRFNNYNHKHVIYMKKNPENNTASRDRQRCT